MYGGDCDVAIAKAAAAVTHVQSQSQEVGSGDEGLGLFSFDLSSQQKRSFSDWRTSSRRAENQYMASTWDSGCRRSWRI